jgi:hypothetical protein
MRKFLIIGSTALYHWYGGTRNPKDLDIMSPAKIHCFSPATLLVETSWNDVFSEIVEINEDPVFIDPHMLMTLKMSHMQWDIKWSKHRNDMSFLQSTGLKKNERIYHALVDHWNTVHGKKKVNLNMPKEEFFNRHVSRKYDHDYLHTIVAFGVVPLHETIKIAGSEVMLDHSKFILLDHETKLKLAMEELLVVAIERNQLTTKSTKVQKLIAVAEAYKKLVTTMTSGWFCDFLLDSHYELFRKNHFIDHLNESLLKLEN